MEEKLKCKKLYKYFDVDICNQNKIFNIFKKYS